MFYVTKYEQTEKGYIVDNILIPLHQGFLTKDRKRLYLFEDKGDVLENIEHNLKKIKGILEHTMMKGISYARIQHCLWDISKSVTVLADKVEFITIPEE